VAIPRGDRLTAGDLRLLALAALCGGVMVHFGERELDGLVLVLLGMVLVAAACFLPSRWSPSSPNGPRSTTGCCPPPSSPCPSPCAASTHLTEKHRTRDGNHAPGAGQALATAI
jgi:hypothetical protein